MADTLDVFISIKSVHTSIGKAWMMVLRHGLDLPTHMSIVWSKNTYALVWPIPIFETNRASAVRIQVYMGKIQCLQVIN